MNASRADSRAFSADDQDPTSSRLWTFVVAGLALYAGLCSTLRFRRIKRMQAQYNFQDRASLSRMTNQDAQEIAKIVIWSEFPIMYDLAMRVALLKTYAVENIAKLLMSVSDLAKPDQAPKRYEDTHILFACFAQYPPSSPLLHKAVARMNYLHAPYVKSGKISNQDLLYVLWASMFEPVRFMKLYEWRALTNMETAAIATMWKHIGTLMGINYAAELGQDQWTNGLDFLDQLTVWAHRYEDQYMLPSPEVEQLGKILFELLLTSYPNFVRPLGYQIALVLLGDRLRHAFSLPEPGIAVSALTYSLLLIRKFVIRYLFLPRPWPQEHFSEPDAQTQRIKHYHYLKEPWYIPGTFYTRWNIESLITWITGGMIPGDGGSDLKPEGFLFQDLGPKAKMGHGLEDNARVESAIRAKVVVGCPFSKPSI